MPRQQINTPTANVVTARAGDGHNQPPGIHHRPLEPGESWEPADGTLEFSPTLWIGWGGTPYPNDPNSAGTVTVSMAIADDDLLRRADEIRARRGAGHDHASPSERMAHFTTHPLTRGELNELVRTARRARDKAFGTDE